MLSCTPMLIIRHGCVGISQVLWWKWLDRVRAASTTPKRRKISKIQRALVLVVHDERIGNLHDHLTKRKEKGHQTRF
jgi:hypothetical protein